MKKYPVRRVLSALLVLAMLLSFAGPVPVLAETAEESNGVSFEQVDNSNVKVNPLDNAAEPTEETEPQYADTDMVRVSILLEEKSTIEAGYSVENIARNEQAMAYRAALAKNQETITASIEKAVGEELDVAWNLTLAANLISANVAYGQIAAIEAVPGVEKVILETCYDPAVLEGEGTVDPTMATSMEQIGSAGAWAAGYTGAGTRIAIIDTGTDTDHQSFDASAFEFSLAYQAGLHDMSIEDYVASLDLLTAEEIASVAEELNAEIDVEQVYGNSKLPYGYNYIDKSFDITHDNDRQGGHGSHVAGIAAANTYIPDGNGGFTNALTSVKVQGVAPDAQILTMKVFGKAGGAYESDYIAAVEDAVILGCDSINMSLGSSHTGYSQSFTAEYQLIMDELVNAGAVLCAAAGNNASWPYYWDSVWNNRVNAYLYADDVNMATHGSPGTYTNTLAVASVDNAGLVGYYFKSGDDVIIYNDYQPSEYGMDNFWTLAGEQEYVFIEGLGYAEDWAVVGEALQGKIAICSRGVSSFVEKATNAVDAGAIGTIIYNNEAGIIGLNMTGYTKTNPAVSITQGQAEVIKSNSTPVTDEAGNVLYYTGTIYVAERSDAGAGSTYSDYNVMAVTSGWGGTGSLEMKPEIAAPGGNIYSVNGTNGSYITMSGTSMASPQVAGMSALVSQYIQENGLTEKTGLTTRQLTQSLLMSTAEAIIDGNSGTYYPILQQGSGLANVTAAITADSYILMDENATASYADGKVKAELGDDPERTGKYEFSFSINNLREYENVFALSAAFFTQDVFEDYATLGMDPENTALYMDYLCTTLAANVTWTVDGEGLLPADGSVRGMDFDGNGAVNSDDGQALLDYVAGVTDSIENAELADVDADGDVDTHDAYEFFKALSSGMVTVPAGGSVNVTVSAQLTEEQMAWLNANFTDGAYIQGFVFAESMGTSEGVAGTTHSIPVLAFYGDWSEPSMFDGQYLEYYYGEETRDPYFSNGTGFAVTYPHDENTMYYLTGNPILPDATYMPERNAVSSGTVINGPVFTNIRNAASTRILVDNTTTGENLFEYTENGMIITPYVYGIWIQRVNMILQGDVSLESASEGDVITMEMGLAAEYYMDDEGNVDWDSLSEGSFIRNTVTIDNTAPVVEQVYLELTDGYGLVVNASDNQYIAGMAIYNDQGNALYDKVGAISDIQPGESGQYVLSLAEMIRLAPSVGDSATVYLQVYDYAMNITTYLVDVSPLLDKLDYSGMWIGFTDGGGVAGVPTAIYGDGLYNRWFTFQPDKLYFSSPFETYQSEWFDDEFRFDLRASEAVTVHRSAYVNGYVFIIGRDNCMYVSSITDLTAYQKVCYFGDEYVYSNVTGLAFNPADGQLYLMLREKIGTGYYDTKETICTVDLVTGALTRLYSLTNIYNPYQNTKSYMRLSGLAIDGEGNFYALTSSWFYRRSAYLYTWTNDMAVDGVIDALRPINDSANGCIMDKVDWDKYDDTYRGMYNHLAWNYETDELYAAVQNSESDNWEYNVMLKLDTETGKGSLVSDYDGGKQDLETDPNTGRSAPINSLFGYAVHSMFYTYNFDTPIVMENTQTPYRVTLSQSEINLLKGSVADLDAEVYPWTMVDKSLTWTSSDPTVALVDEDGVVTLVGVGTATITAASKVDPSVTATCSVISFMPDVDLRGLFTTADGAYWSDFNPATVPTWTKASGKVDSFKAGTQAGDKIYAHDGESLYSIDPTTFAATKVAALDEELLWTDASVMSFEGKDYIFALCMDGTGYYLIDPATGEKVFDTFMGEDSDLTKRPGVAVHMYLNEYRSRPDRGRYVFDGYILTETGRLYSTMFDVMATYGDVFPYGLETVGETGLTITGSASMEMDTTTGYLIVTVAEESGTKVYAIDPETAFVVDMGTFTGVSSVVGLYPAAAAAEGTESTAAVKRTAFAAAPASVVEKGEDSVTVTVTAKDANGTQVDSTNGLVTVNYDATKLSLTDILVNGNYTAKVEADGTITFAYVALDTIPAGKTVATLTFTANETVNSYVTVTQQQVNNEAGYTETLFVELTHANTELRDAKEPTCTEEGYTGDVYCTDCGALVSKGEVIPATGHTFGEWVATKEATCTEYGEETHTCEVCGFSETREAAPIDCPSAAFEDIDTDQWYHEFVDYVVAKGLMQGVSDTAFDPNGNLTRAMMVTVLYRAAGAPEVENASKFTDVAADQWYTDAVAWAAENGIVYGITDTTFCPNQNVTREQAATILYRYVTEYLEVEVEEGAELNYTDAEQISDYAREAVAWATAEGFFQGFPDGSIQPKGTLTRAQMAKLLTVLAEKF